MGIRGGQRVKFRLLSRRDAAALVLKDEVGAADDDLLALHHTGDAVGHHILHLRMVLLVGQPVPLCLRHHGVCHGMGVMLLQTGGKPQHFRLVASAEGDDRRHGGGRIGQRAGLVEHNGVRLGHRLQKASALDGDVIATALPHGGQHRDGDGQLQGTGEVHHQHRQHFRHIPGQKIGQRRAAQRIGHQSVRHPGGFVLGGGFQLLRLLDHVNHPVIPPTAGGFLHGDDALALLRHRPGIDGTAGVLRHGHGFAGEGGLVHHGLALHHPAVQRDHAAGANHDTVARLHVGDLRQHLDAVYLLPDAVHPQAHGGGEVGHGLFVGPLLQNFAQMQHEHNGAGGGKIAPCHGHRNSGGIQHGDGQFAVPQCRKPLPDVLYGAEQCQCRGDGRRQKQLGDTPPHDGDSQLVLKLPVQCPGGMLRHQLHSFRLGEGELCQRTEYVSALRLIEHHRVLRPVVDPDLPYAVLGAQIVFQHICLG